MPEASLQPQKWHRVAVTVGPEETARGSDLPIPPPSYPSSGRSTRRSARGGFNPSGDDDADDDEDYDEDGDEEALHNFMRQGRQMGGMGVGGIGSMGGMGGGRRGGGETRARIMQTYVNARKCATISSEKRGVLAIPDGRFAASTEVSSRLIWRFCVVSSWKKT